MIYLKTFTLPSIDSEYHYLTYGNVEIENRATGHRSIKENCDIYRTCYNSVYPFLVLSKKELRRVDFDYITIFCGGNGSGETTLLNIIAQKLGLMRTAPYNGSVFFDDYLLLCRAQMQEVYLQNSLTIRTVWGGLSRATMCSITCSSCGNRATAWIQSAGVFERGERL